MGRSQSTPGLVESRGKVPLEEMWVPPGLMGLTSAYPRSLVGSPPRPSPDSPVSTSSGRSHHHTPASQAKSGKTHYSRYSGWVVVNEDTFTLYVILCQTRCYFHSIILPNLKNHILDNGIWWCL